MNSLEKCEKALSKLTEFLAEKNMTEATKAGVIQAFKFTYEVFWKHFQKIAINQGIETPNSPRQAVVFAFSLGLIEDEKSWIAMMRDRNETSHTYNEDVAEKIFQKIKDVYRSQFEKVLLKMKDIN
jgi:nucleotidyltransferase substrate binding protein (TIGR01987 family)